MNSKLKKSLSLLVSLVMLLSVCTVGFTAFGAGDVKIDSVNFEDDNFKKFQMDLYEFYNLGMGEPFPVSAVNKMGFGELLDEMEEILKTQ